MSSSSSEGTHSLHFYNSLLSLSLSQLSIRHNNFLGAVVLCSWVARMREVERLFLKSERQSAAFFWSSGGLGLRWYFVVFPGACVSSIGSLFRGPIGSRARDRAAGSYTECAAGTRQPSALRSASLLVHRILLGTAQGQRQLGTLHTPPRVDTGFQNRALSR